LAAASPGPGVTVGGEVTEIQLFYGDIIVDFSATVTSPSGVELDATAEMLSDIQALITLAEPMSEEGEYAVRHTITSIDTDVVEAAYLFTYEASAPPPQLIFVPEEESGTSPIVWVVIGVGGLVIAVLAWRLIVAIRRRSTPADDQLA
jgi:methionine-rich copper-binding protein CopC